MDWIEITGLVGSGLSSITFVPQVVQAWRTKSVGDLNTSMILIITLSTIVWLVYGIGRGALPVIICNAIIFFLSLLLLYFKYSFPQKK
jgi:MtN3 and saliva related transmembrane protein